MSRLGGPAVYLPRMLVDRIAEHGRPQVYPHRDRLDAGLLMVDLPHDAQPSALRDALPGDSGRFMRVDASAAVDRVNRTLPPVIDAVRHHGGSVLSVSRGCAFAVFPGADGAARARAASIRIEREFAGQPGAVRQRLHFGTVDAIHLGDEARSHFLVSGTSVASLARMTRGAMHGTVLVSAEARARMQDDILPVTPPDPNRDVPDLAAYLPLGVDAMLERADGAYRSVACVWLETRGGQLDELQPFYLALCEVLRRYEGALVKSHPSQHGTRWLCAFGMAVAHEDDPERAARAALDLQAQMSNAIQLRGGLHGGVVASVATGQIDRRTLEIIGDVVVVAANAMECADWGEVWMTDVQRRFTPSVQVLPRGEYALGAAQQTVRLFSLFGQRPAARAVNVLAPLVGRDREIAALRDVLRAALEGRGTAIGICGETGLGKSRLKHEVTLMASPLGYAVHRGQAVSVGGVAYGVVAQLVAGAMGLPLGAEREVVLERVRTECQRLELTPDLRHHLAEVLGHRYHDTPLTAQSPKDIRLRNMQAIRAYVAAVSHDQPRLFVLDDLHWADETTLEAVAHLIEAVHTSSAVLLLLYRPGYPVPDDVPEIRLREIDGDDVARLAAALIGGPLAPEVEQLARDHAQGNPFYVEEIARHLHEASLLTVRRGRYALIREPTPDEVPRTLEALIASRLDRLPPAVQQVAQVGAVLGRRFPRLLLTHFDEVSGQVERALNVLEEAHILFKAVEHDEPIYVFKHALTREVVYGSILLRRRRRLHRAAAALIEGLFAGAREQFMPLLAHHYEQAGDRGPARSCYLAAAQRAAGRFAHGEAERLYRGYLGLVDQPTGESVSVRNFLASEVLHQRGDLKQAAEEHDRALSDGKRIGDVSGQGIALRGLATIYWETGFMQQAEGACERALALLRQSGDRRATGTALMTLANIRGDQGHLDDAAAMYEEALAIHREIGNDHGAGLTLSNLAEVHRLQGRPDRARELYEEALTLTEQSGNQPSSGVVLSNLAVVYHELGETDAARTVFHRALAIHREVGARAFEAYTRCEIVRLERRLGAGHDELTRMIDKAMAVARDAGTIDQALCLCEQGHIALADGHSARPQLAAAEELTPVSKVGADSEFGAAIVRLRHAVEAFEIGLPLVRGERADDLPDALRRRFIESGEFPHLRF